MRINTNVAALNSYNQLQNTNNNLSKSLERLSSGKRINGAADDAAGLAISEKMNSQTKGLAMAQRNAQDGISMIQTAEGALKETHSILQRMRELSVQSANDTNTKEDRVEIQKEVDQLATELTRIGETTEFNTQNLLDGTLSATKFQIGANKGQSMEVSINDMRAEELGVAGKGGIEVEVGASLTTFGKTAEATAVTENTTYDVTKFDEVKGVGDGLKFTDSDTDTQTGIDAKYGLTDSEGKLVAISADGKDYTMLSEATAAEDLAADTKFASHTKAHGSEGALLFEAFDFGNKVTSGEVKAGYFTNDGANLKLSATTNVEFEEGQELNSGEYTVKKASDYAASDGVVSGDDGYKLVLVDSEDNVMAATAFDSSTDDHQIWESFEANQTADEGEKIFSLAKANAYEAKDTVEVSSDGGIDVSTQEAADNAISTLDDAIANVSGERSKLGAFQNRLDHTINNLNTAEENLTAAESRISDVDMAKEMMNMSKQQILSQAGTAMMAQANQLPQGVLQLLG